MIGKLFKEAWSDSHNAAHRFLFLLFIKFIFYVMATLIRKVWYSENIKNGVFSSKYVPEHRKISENNLFAASHFGQLHETIGWNEV